MSGETCAACGRRRGDPAWRHVDDLVMTSDGDFDVTVCHRIMVAGPDGELVAKLPDEDELREAFDGKSAKS